MLGLVRVLASCAVLRRGYMGAATNTIIDTGLAIKRERREGRESRDRLAAQQQTSLTFSFLFLLMMWNKMYR